MLGPEPVRRRIGALAKHPRGRDVFGASKRQWQLGATWSEVELVAFERERKVELPASFRRWLLHVGASHACPGSGLFTGADDERRLTVRTTLRLPAKGRQKRKAAGPSFRTGGLAHCTE